MSPSDDFKNLTRYTKLIFIYANTLAWSSSITIIEKLTSSFPFQIEIRLSYLSMSFAYGFIAAGQADISFGIGYILLVLCMFAPSLIRLLTMEAPAVAPEITMLNHLSVSIDDYIIKVWILRKWRQPDRKIPNEDYSIEMILIDEEVCNPHVSYSYGFEVSRLFLNDDIDDIRTYKKSLMKKAVDNPSLIQLPFGVAMLCSLEDDFLTNKGFTTIGEICEIIEVKCVVLMGTIKAISKDTCWYYMACDKCNHKVVTKFSTRLKEDGSGDFEDEIVYECNNKKCNAKVISPVPRFKIQVRVQDMTGVVSLTIFDRDVTKLIHKFARELLDGVDQKFAFKIEVSDFNLKNNYQVYGILKITNDSSILSELDKRVNIIQPNDSDSLNLTMSEFTSQDTTGMKVMSFSGDNSTPTLFTNVKRKHIDVYDLEEHSSARPKKSLTIADEEKHKLDVASKRKLIIPKLEKF
ncbi:hypothetical protein E3N88_14170 [Mikania micrantha]|uniref:Replication factor A C-terminal domain-containing protein n=1 Tax=Mikania micrantha TaxID=192012 RepID=A0A5N6P0M8_9ASTR|nr:hypothetical protein E3N88_14170 [Mikania micrantha]